MVSFTLLLLYPQEKALDIHWKVGWVGCRASLDVVEKIKVLALLGIEPWLSNP
jgi:hypothetical protein